LFQKKKEQQRSQNKSPKKKRRALLLLIGGIVSLILALLIFSDHLPFQSTLGKKGKSFYVKGGETRPVLSPSLFVGRASQAYAAAREYPKVFDQVFCYCGCDEPPTYHKSLLSCFTENHGAG
jgi:hypothetical protein